jgi:2-C-methyl-D-erythritol 4-phosphate cytidylyltransferase/2-C-methyl-D-erythritol 2,4-cyclodiphosphate synthase
MHVGVIIVAAGRSQRMGLAVPKPLLDLGGQTMLRRSVDAFDAHPLVSELVVVLPQDLVEAGPSLVGRTAHPCQLVEGGERRQDSVRRGFSQISASAEIVLIHDAARPFVDGRLIERVVMAAREAGAAVPAVPARDTVKRVDLDRRIVSETLPREQIWLAQTPQGFQRLVLARAMQAVDATAEATDEAMMVEHAGHPVRVVAGDERNVKITTPDDLAAARSRLAPVPRVGTGYDLHRLVEGRPLVLAGILLATDRGPLGHSDGDVLSHALIDAILGAAGDRDIGQHFPDADPQWKGAAGLDLLSRAVASVRQSGFTVASVDATVILERPRLAPHLPAIRQQLAHVLGVPASAVSVKGKTNEGLDAVGRGEAIVAHAVAVLVSGDSR